MLGGTVYILRSVAPLTPGWYVLSLWGTAKS